MRYTILDCYTDEPAGLGVPPYLGVYPRYIAGKLMDEGHEVSYLTIDDVRLISKVARRKGLQTDIRTYNLTGKDATAVLENSQCLVVICGVHVPGKYLSAVPGTLYEVEKLIRPLRCRTVVAGPAATAFGSRLEGGKSAERMPHIFDEAWQDYPFDEIARYAVAGSALVAQIPYLIVAEIESARGCAKPVACSFCTEPLKSRLMFRRIDDIVAEVGALRAHGVVHFRLGKQSDFFAWSARDIEEMLTRIRSIPGIRTLHIDNVDPANVTEEKVKLIVQHCTEGNVAALGIETFDPVVVKSNLLNSSVETSMRAIRLINKFGAERGENGMPKFLPGINILFGLKDESKETHVENMRCLQRIMDEGLLVRRINIRQVALFPGTMLHDTCRDRFLRKNKKHYWKWRDEIRQNIDNPMLKRLVPKGSVLKAVRMEIHDGKTTFGRQIGTYPLIIGIPGRLELGTFHDVQVTGHMLRSVVGEVIPPGF
jgi:radical SAM superfamily enzyme with C-terminal helix-hairpin-helix motif